jgi:hypothetical protein
MEARAVGRAGEGRQVRQETARGGNRTEGNADPNREKKPKEAAAKQTASKPQRKSA